jgi:hypothetical protein
MLKTVEGVYRYGVIQLAEAPHQIVESRVLVTFLEDDLLHDHQPALMYFGMYAGPIQSIESDFINAEFAGDEDDELEWVADQIHP